MGKYFIAICMAVIFMAGIAGAEETTLVVRAKSRDAKFIGTSMGGAMVIVRDSETREIIAQGLTEGGTGNTDRIMIEPLKRGVLLSDDSAAKVEIMMDIDLPLLVDIEVRAPYGQKQSMITGTTQVWLLPGKDILGDGIVVEIPGFAVDVLSPSAAGQVSLNGGMVMIPVRANIVMMCGCPIVPGGLWDANQYEVRAIVLHNGAIRGTVPMKYAGKTSTFEAEFGVSRQGDYEVMVYAYDPATGNTGLDKTTVVVK